MLDRNKLKSDLKSNKAFQGARQGNSGPRWSFMSTKDVQDGQHLLRLYWPHPKFCPSDYLVNSTYKIVVNADDEGALCLAPEACDPPMEPCYLTERILYQIVQRKLMEDFSPNFAEAIDKCFPWKRYIFPVAIMSTAVSVGKREVPGKGGAASKSYDIFEYSATAKPGMTNAAHEGNVISFAGPHPRVWEISADAEAMCNGLFKVMLDYEDRHGCSISDPQRGALITMQRSGNVFAFFANEPSPCDPAMVQSHGSMFDINGNRKKNKLGPIYREPEAIQNLWERSWMYARLRDRYELDLRTDDQLRRAGREDLIKPNWEAKSLEEAPIYATNNKTGFQPPASMASAAGPIDMSKLFAGFGDLPQG